MTGPTQNLGSEAQGMQIAQMVLDGLTLALGKVGAGTPLGQSLAKALVDIGKHIPPGSTSPQGVSNAMKTMAMKQHQMAPHMAAQGAGAPPGGAPPGAGAAPPQPPRPAA